MKAVNKIIGIGTDIVSHARINHLLENFGERFVNRILSEQEQLAYQKTVSPDTYMAKRFAAKEAVAKALGTGIGAHVAFNEISVTNLNTGQPVVTFLGKAKDYIDSLGNITVWISLSDEKDYSLAFAIVTSE